ncbi:unnamed protein product [Gordionus sp. m RMFG-2023]
MSIIITPNLIDDVRSRENLWNPQDKEFYNRKLKYRGWEEIGAIHGVSSSTAKTKFKHIKDAYRKQKKKVLTPSGKGNDICEYKYAHLMRFLDIVTKHRPRGNSASMSMDTCKYTDVNFMDLSLPSSIEDNKDFNLKDLSQHNIIVEDISPIEESSLHKEYNKKMPIYNTNNFNKIFNKIAQLEQEKIKLIKDSIADDMFTYFKSFKSMYDKFDDSDKLNLRCNILWCMMYPKINLFKDTAYN